MEAGGVFTKLKLVLAFVGLMVEIKTLGEFRDRVRSLREARRGTVFSRA